MQESTGHFSGGNWGSGTRPRITLPCSKHPSRGVQGPTQIPKSNASVASGAQPCSLFQQVLSHTQTPRSSCPRSRVTANPRSPANSLSTLFTPPRSERPLSRHSPLSVWLPVQSLLQTVSFARAENEPVSTAVTPAYSKWVDQYWMDGLVSRGTDEWSDRRTDRRVDRWMNEWVVERQMDG